MPYANNASARIYYEVAGEGPPMVLIHANPFDHRLWLYQAARFSERYRTIAVDMRGYGRSDKPTNSFSLRDMAADVMAVFDQEQLGRAVFCGVSTGSGISLLIAQEWPELVRALILVGGSSRGPARMQARIEGFLSDDLAAYHAEHLRDCVAPEFAASPHGSWLLSLFSCDSCNLNGESIAQIFRARMACDLSDGLTRITAPTLIVNGELDASLPAGRETAARIPNAKHVVISGAGHACNLERPAEFERAALAFLIDFGLWGP